MGLEPRARRLLAMLAAHGGNAGALTGIAARRRALEQLADLAAGPPPHVARVRDLPADGSRPPLRLYDPAPDEELPGLVFLHGGGWTAGSLHTHHVLCRALAASGKLRVAAVDYRLAPEHPRPAASEDAESALSWLATRAAPLGVAGDSAGAHIAAELALAHRERLALQLLICPILDPCGDHPSRRLFREGHFIDPLAFGEDRDAYFGATAVSILDRGDLRGAPPAQIHVAEFDPFRDEGQAYAARLARAGVEVETTAHDGMIHYFYALAGAIPAARSGVVAMARAAGDRLRKPRS